MKAPAYYNVYPRFSNSYRTSLANSSGFVRQFENFYVTYRQQIYNFSGKKNC